MTALRRSVPPLGGKLESVDAYVVVDLPDNISATAVALGVNQSGGASVKTIVLIAPEDIATRPARKPWTAGHRGADCWTNRSVANRLENPRVRPPSVCCRRRRADQEQALPWSAWAPAALAAASVMYSPCLVFP